MLSNGIELPTSTPIVKQKRIYIRKPKSSIISIQPEPEPITSEPEPIQPETIVTETIVKKEKKPRTEKQIQAFLKMKEAQEARQVISRDDRKQQKQLSADDRRLAKLRASILELEPAQPAQPAPTQPIKKTRKPYVRRVGLDSKEPYVRRESTRESTTPFAEGRMLAPEFQVSTDREIIFM